MKSSQRTLTMFVEVVAPRYQHHTTHSQRKRDIFLEVLCFL